MTAKSHDLALLLARVAIGALFIPAGLSKLINLGGFAASLESRGVPYASVFAPIGALIEFLGGIAVVVGVHVRFASVLLILFTVVATFIAHRFWEFEGSARQTQQSQFLKNFAIAGGYVLLLVVGGGRYCLDRLWRRGARGMPGYA